MVRHGSRFSITFGVPNRAVLAARRPAVEAAAGALGDAYAANVWPQMKIAWGTYPSQLGHTAVSGCFRCHDGDHVDQAGQASSQDCGLCHALLANGEVDPPILKQLRQARGAGGAARAKMPRCGATPGCS